MPRTKKRVPTVLRPVALENRTMLSGDFPGPTPPPMPFGSTGSAGLAAEVAEFDQTRIIVRYRDDHSAASAPHPRGLVPGRSLGEVGGLRVVGVDPAVGVASTLDAARDDPRVLYAEPDYVIRSAATPNDPRFGELWGLRNTGQASAFNPGILGSARADIDATAAWDRTTGSRGVVVAVLDSGIDPDHPDLAANLWANPGELAGNGLDDDGNGFVDDVRGWDFINRDNDPRDDHGHGTHVAGTIGAVGDNGRGVAGVAWDVSIMPLKVLDRFGNGRISAAIDAINYAWRNGASISNASWGSPFYSQGLRDAIEEARIASGHLVVAAAGNSSANLDGPGSPRFYPASYDLPNIISVAASDRNDRLAWFSNFGATSVDLAAPGDEILSTTPHNQYTILSGTSMAAPHVSGAAALLKSVMPTATYEQLVAALVGSVDTSDALTGLTASGGRLNVANALQSLTAEPALRGGVVELSGLDQWTRVTLDRSYASMVVAATPVVHRDRPSLMTRVRDVGGNQFEISVTAAESSSAPPSSISLVDSGFEAPWAGEAGAFGSFRYGPAGTAWSYAGGAGVAADGSGFTAGNPPAPEGRQVAFLQQGGAIGQAVAVPAAGAYRLSLRAAQRGNHQPGGYHDFAVTVDGVEAARLRASGTSYEPLEATLALAAGTRTIALRGVNTAGGDNTSLIDDLRLEPLTTEAATLSGGGFEAPWAGEAGAFGSFRYGPAGTAWSYAGGAGVAADGSGFTAGNPPAPEGRQVAFLQQGGAIGQAVAVPAAGAYRLSLRAAQRGNHQPGGYHDFAVTVDGVEAARLRASGTSYGPLEATLTLAAGVRTIALRGVNTAGGDNTSLIDDLRLERIDEAFSSPIRVHYLVAEEGVYTAASHGVTMEARKKTAAMADSGGPGGAFAGQRAEYAQHYAAPVVVGQVMTSDDARPSVFWARGATRTVAPSPTDLFVGMHVGEDAIRARSPETLGYFVFEAGAHRAVGVDLVAGRTGPAIGGLDDSPPFTASLSGLGSATSAVVSTATMNDPDGAWGALFGHDPVRPDGLDLVAVEDRWLDPERSHAPEAMSYVVLGQASAVREEFGGRPATPGLSAITPRIAITRTSGTEPFVVQVSAAETSVNAGDAFTDLEYLWDFGDPSGTETFVHPVSGDLVGANSDQQGPEAAYVYRDPGTYTITLTVRGKDQHGSIITVSTSTLLRPALQEVLVQNASGGYFWLTASVDGGPGRTTGLIPHNASPDQIVAALAALPNIGQGNLRTSAHLWVEATGMLIDRRLSLKVEGSALVGNGQGTPRVLIGDRNPGGSASAVTVTAWAGPDVHFDSNYDGISSGAPNGSIAAPFNTFAQLRAAITSGVSQRILIKRGSRFAGDGELVMYDFPAGPLRVTSYGDPALPRPIIESNAGPGGTALGLVARSSRPVSDIVFDGLDVRSQGRAFGIFTFIYDGGLAYQVDNVHVLDTAFRSSNTTHGWIPLIQIYAHETYVNDPRRGEAFVFWNCTFDHRRLTGSADFQVGIDLDATRFVSVVGGRIAGGGPGPHGGVYFNHHVYANVYDHILLRWMRFEEGEGPVNFAVKLRQEGNTPGQVQSRTLIDGCDFGGPANGVGTGQWNDGRDFGTVLIQDSAFHLGEARGFQSMGMYVDGVRRLVVRDSSFYDNEHQGVNILGGVRDLEFGFYRNDVYVPAEGTPTTGLLVYAALGSAEILENTFFFDGPQAGFVAPFFARLDAMAAWTIDRNQYWAPRAGSVVFGDLASWRAYTFPEWQALGFDRDGRYADPRWVDPARGDFRGRG